MMIPPDHARYQELAAAAGDPLNRPSAASMRPRASATRARPDGLYGRQDGAVLEFSEEVYEEKA